MAASYTGRVEEGGGRRWRQYLAAAVVDLTGMVQGMAVGWPSPVLPYLQSPDSPIGDQPMTDESASWLGSLVCLGALFATPIFSYLCNRISRKTTGYIVALPSIVGWAMVLGTQSETVLLAARFIIGISAGGNVIHCPLYVTEISEVSIRGSLGTIMLFMTNGGIVVSYIIGSYVSYTAFNCICLAVPIMYILAFIWMPESPVYLMIEGREEEARRSLEWMRSKNSLGINEEMKSIAEYTKGSGGTISGIFSSRGTMKALFLGIVLAANVELTGVFAVIIYTVTIFTSAGVSFSPYTSTILAGTLLTAGVMVSTVLIDRAGRKIIMLVSNLTAALCLGIIGGYFYLKSISVDMSNYGWVPVTAVSAYMVVIGVGVCTIPYVIISEIFSVEYKSLGTTFSILVLWLTAFLVARFFTDLVKIVGTHGSFWLFGVLCLICEAFVHFAVPETKGRTLESILQELNSK